MMCYYLNVHFQAKELNEQTNCVLLPSKQSTKLSPSKFCEIKTCHSLVKRNSQPDNLVSHKALCVEWILLVLKQPLSGA